MADEKSAISVPLAGKARRVEIRSPALTGLLVLAVFYTIYFTRTVLLPLVLALLLSYLLAPVVRALARIRVPPLVGSATVLLAMVVVGVFLGSMLVDPAAAWIEKAPSSVQQLQQKLLPLKKPIERVTQATGEIEKMVKPGGTEKPKTVEVSRGHFLEQVFGQTSGLVAHLLTMLILLYFLLAYDGLFFGKLIKVVPRFSDKKRAAAIMHEVETSISRYLVTITLINAGLGFAVGLAMLFLGLPNPILWGAAAMVLNFVPYLGAFVGIVSVMLTALLTFDSVGYALACPGAYLVIASLEGSFITPMFLGRSMTLNPVVILIALIFWGWLWGIAGMILAVPILAVLDILCEHIPDPLAPIGEFLRR